MIDPAADAASSLGFPGAGLLVAALMAASRPTTLREWITSYVTDELGESLSDVEFFIHGTTESRAEAFQLDNTKSLFTAVDPETAKAFAQRTVEKDSKPGQPAPERGGIIIVLPKKVAQALTGGSKPLLTKKPVDDNSRAQEYIFSPGAMDMVDRYGYIQHIPKEYMK